MRFVFMGSSDFGIPALEALLNIGHRVAGIVTAPASKKGRGLGLSDSPLAIYAQDRELGPVLTPQSLVGDSVADELKAIAADVFVVVAFRILPPAIFGIPRLGTYNIHASLLPRYRGPAPIQRSIAAGEQETGVTIFKIDAGIDTGAIVLSKTTAIGPLETTPELSGRLSALGAQAIVEALARVEGGSVVYEQQDHSVACGAPKLTKAEGKIDWTEPAQLIFNKIRAFKPFPGTYTFLDGMRISIEWGIRVGDAAPRGLPGAIAGIGKEGVEVECGSGLLRILEVKPEGRKSMPARDFVAGRQLGVGTRFS